MFASQNISLLLASQSPRRQELLALIGLPFAVKPVALDESVGIGEPPLAYAQRLAREKAELAVLQNPGTKVIAADTVVVDGGEALGKPADAPAAARMLRRLQRAPHSVVTALVVAGGVAAVTASDRPCLSQRANEKDFARHRSNRFFRRQSAVGYHAGSPVSMPTDQRGPSVGHLGHQIAGRAVAPWSSLSRPH